MKIYQVAYRDSSDEHTGYEYFSNKADAIKADKKNSGNQTRDEIVELDFKLYKRDIIMLLNRVASHPDNG